MTSSNLSELFAKMIKDPGYDKWSQEVGLDWLSLGQEAIVVGLDSRSKHLSRLIKIQEVSVGGLYPSSSEQLNSDFVNPVYCELIDTSSSRPVPVKIIDIRDKGRYRNTKEGGTDTDPVAIIYKSDSNTVISFVMDNSGETANLFYIYKPASLAVSGVDGASADVDPDVYGLDNLMLLYAKHMYHISEGQVDLAQSTLVAFDKTLSDMNAKVVQNVQNL